MLAALYACQFQVFLVVAALLGLAYYQKSTKPLLAALAIYLLMNVDAILLNIPPVSFFEALNWNWQGKILELLLGLMVIYAFRWVTPQQAGMNLPKHWQSFLYVILLGLIVAVISAVIAAVPGYSLYTHPDTETLLYQATMPGLAEEILYRGIFLALLNQCFGKPWIFFKVKLGWGYILVSLLFFAVHWIQYDPMGHHLIFSDQYLDLAECLFISFALGFIREKTGSIWPAVVFHNLCNTAF